METSGAPRSLLLVEDDPANWLTLSALLEEAGFAVDIAESCAQAARYLEGRPRYDAVLLDSLLGDGNGWELVPLIRHRVPAARVVLVSGQEGAGAWTPADALFHKGDDVGQLLECLERLLRRELG
ncbi:MAG: response regulator [Hyalangium sp.]|uniref:response regulator n=1 Tax=Hyalangium sp. TaxID=2028555 RepID=UPI0038998836